MKPVKDHWYRANVLNEPCLYPSCGRLQADHVESCGEWMGPRHFFLPRLLHPSRCVRCDRRVGHSTHHGSRKNRQLRWDRWNRLRDIMRGRS